MPCILHNTRKNILTAAGKLFSDSGFSATSMDEVATLAGIKKSTLYHYFISKDELLKEIVDSLTKKLISELDLTTKNNTNSLESLQKIIERLLDFREVYPEVHIFAMLAVADGDRRNVAKYILKVKKKLFMQLKKMIYELDPCLDKNEETASLIAYTIFGMIINANVNDNAKDVKKTLNHLIKVLTHLRNSANK